MGRMVVYVWSLARHILQYVTGREGGAGLTGRDVWACVGERMVGGMGGVRRAGRRCAARTCASVARKRARTGAGGEGAAGALVCAMDAHMREKRAQVRVFLAFPVPHPTQPVTRSPFTVPNLV